MPAPRRSNLSGAAAAILLSCLLIAVAGCSGSASQTRPGNPASRQPEIVREDVSFPIGKGISTVEIDNRYGEINIRSHDEDEVGIHGVAQSLPPDFARAHVVSSRNGEVLHLVVELLDGKTGGRYDMAAYVPNSMSLILHGVRDRVDARKRAAPLTISTTSGDINASSLGRLDLSTGSGTIKAAAMSERWDGSSSIRSESGRIIVLVPLSGDIFLNAETGGRLSNDFGLSVHSRASGGFMSAARYGAGTSNLHVSSDSGEVILEHAVLLEEDGAPSDEVRLRSVFDELAGPDQLGPEHWGF